MHRAIKVFQAFLISALAITGLAQGAISAEQYQSELPGTVFTVEDSNITAIVDIFPLVAECAKSFVVEEGGYLVATSHAILDARAYQLRGAPALHSVIQRAELSAQATAAQFLSELKLHRTISAGTTESQTASGMMAAEDEIMQHFSTTASLVDSMVTTSSLDFFLRGGKQVGTVLISLGEDGLCVGVRYEFPLDQDNFDPASRVDTPNTGGIAVEPKPAEPQNESPNKLHTLPPAGSTSGDW